MSRRIGWLGLVLAAVVPASTVYAADGLQTLPSTHSVAETVNRLESAVQSAGFKVFARVDHAAGAKRVNMPLPPTELLIFGKPDAGTLLMQSQRTVGIDLPLKYLVWETGRGEVMIGWNDPQVLFDDLNGSQLQVTSFVQHSDTPRFTRCSQCFCGSQPWSFHSHISCCKASLTNCRVQSLNEFFQLFNTLSQSV